MIDVEHRAFIPADGREARVSRDGVSADEWREVVFQTSTGEEVGRAPLTVEKPLWGLTTEELHALYLEAKR